VYLASEAGRYMEFLIILPGLVTGLAGSLGASRAVTEVL